VTVVVDVTKGPRGRMNRNGFVIDPKRVAVSQVALSSAQQ
jgi:hypothetical protein